jgi:GNAT superfamily N-acetyltransferase
VINDDNYPVFQNFLTPGVRELTESGFPAVRLGLIAEYDDAAAGALAGVVRNGCFEILSLYVLPEYRRRGGATLLLDELLDVLTRSDIVRVTVDYSVSRGEHRALWAFLEDYGFAQETPEGCIYGTTLGQIAQADYFRGVSDIGTAVPFAKLPEILIKTLDRKMRAEGDPLLDRPLEEAEFDRDVSAAVVSGGNITSFAILDRSYDGNLTLAAARADAAHPSSFGTVLRAAFCFGQEKYPPETPVILHVAAPEASSLLRRLGFECEPLSFTAVMERFPKVEFI